jgi:hypothetical protein
MHQLDVGSVDRPLVWRLVLESEELVLLIDLTEAPSACRSVGFFLKCLLQFVMNHGPRL